MKSDIHPESHPILFRDTSTNKEFFAYSAIKLTGKEETKKHDGLDCTVVLIEVSSSSHPFFTGKQHFVDSSGRVQKFERARQKAAEAQK